MANQTDQGEGKDTLRIRPTTSEVLLIAIATLIGYFVAFAYHRDYSLVFGIPPELIGVDPGSLLLAASGILAFVLAFGTLAAFALLISGQPSNVFARRVRRLIVPLLLGSLLVTTYQQNRVVMLLIFAFIVLYEFVRPLFKYPHIRGYLRKLQTDEDEGGGFSPAVRPFTVPILFVLLSLVVIGLGGAAGRFTAVTTTRFLVLDDSPDFVVPKLDADKVIAVRIDRKAKKILPEVVVITREQGQPLRLRWEHIGRLTPSDR